jgi:hypothetical protein
MLTSKLSPGATVLAEVTTLTVAPAAPALVKVPDSVCVGVAEETPSPGVCVSWDELAEVTTLTGAPAGPALVKVADDEDELPQPVKRIMMAPMPSNTVNSLTLMNFVIS